MIQITIDNALKCYTFQKQSQDSGVALYFGQKSSYGRGGRKQPGPANFWHFMCVCVGNEAMKSIGLSSTVQML